MPTTSVRRRISRFDLEQYAATTDLGWQRQRSNRRCVLPGCGYGSARAGMCGLHGQRWDRAGRPDHKSWITAAGPVPPPAAGAVCRMPWCQIWPQAGGPFCHAHNQTWKANGRPDVDAFASDFGGFSSTADETVRLAELPPQLRLEIAYALQCRRDERGSKTFPAVVMQLVRFLTEAGASSLLEGARTTGAPQPRGERGAVPPLSEVTRVAQRK